MIYDMTIRYLCVIIYANDKGRFERLESKGITEDMHKAKRWDARETERIFANEIDNEYAFIYAKPDRQSLEEAEQLIEKVWRETLDNRLLKLP